MPQHPYQIIYEYLRQAVRTVLTKVQGLETPRREIELSFSDGQTANEDTAYPDNQEN